MRLTELGKCPGLPRKASLFACICCQHTWGRCQEGWTGWQATGLCPWGLSCRGRRAWCPEGSGHPLPSHGAVGRALTYWKGRRMARRNPLKKRVMSSTNSTPWQEVKSNCRGQGAISPGPGAETHDFCSHPTNQCIALPGGTLRPLRPLPLLSPQPSPAHGHPADLGLEAEDGD